MLFLHIAGGIVVAILLIIGGIYLIFRYWCSDFSNSFLEDNFPALSVHLNKDLAPEWLKKKEAENHINQFLALGFEQGRSYLIPEFDGVKLTSFFKGSYTGVLYSIPKVGYIFDILFESVDGSCLTITTAPMGAELDAPPEQQKIYLPDEGVTALYSRMKAERADAEGTSMGDHNFTDKFETYYRQEQIFRNRNGGTSFEEFRKIADNMKSVKSDKQVQEAFIAHKIEELEYWNESALEEFYKNRNSSNDDMYDAEYFIVPHNTDPAAFVHYLASVDMVPDENIDVIANSMRGQKNILKLFNEINQSRSRDLRADHAGDIEFPVKAEIYKLKYQH